MPTPSTLTMNEQTKPERQRVLEEAMKCVTRDRNASYGSPEDNFNHIADLWNAQLKSRLGEFKFTALDVAVMFCLMKIARIRTSPAKDDNYIDLAGYAACAADCATSAPPKINLDINSTYTPARDYWKDFKFNFTIPESSPDLWGDKSFPKWKPGLDTRHMEAGLQGEKND